jgi:hypothetical protein
MRLVPDEELERLAAEHGPGSYQSAMLADVRARRAKDEQVHCYQLGEFLVICPMPTPEEEVLLQLAYEATRHMKGSRLTNIADVLAAFGEPDEVVTRSERMTSRIWVCSSCSEMVTSDEPVPAPSPCSFCGGIAFRKA